MRTILIALLSLCLASTAIAQKVTGKNEIQLQNLTPAVKSLQIKLEGSELVKSVLEDVGGMTQDIINNSRSKVEKMTVRGEPVATPYVPVFQNLQVLLKARAPAVDAVEQIYTVTVQLSEAGNPSGAMSQNFAYNAAQRTNFKNVLAQYLRDKLNLEARQTIMPTPATTTPNTQPAVPVAVDPVAPVAPIPNQHYQESVALDAQIKMLQNRITRDMDELKKLKARKAALQQ